MGGGAEKDAIEILIGLSPEARTAWRSKARSWERASRKRPGDRAARARLGACLVRLGRTSEGVRFLDSALRQGFDAEGLAARAEAGLQRGDLSGASRDIEAALRGCPGLAVALFLRSLLRRARGERPGALADARRLAEGIPLAGAQALLGLLLQDEGNEAAAADCFGSAVALAGSETWPYAFRALSRQARGDRAGALGDLEVAASGYPSVWICGARARLLNDSGAFEAALSELARLARRFPKSPEPRLLSAAICRDQAQYAKASQHFDRASRLRPDDPSIAGGRARLLMMQGRFKEALLDLEKASRLDPVGVDWALDRVRVRILLGQFREANAELSALESALPRTHDSRFSWLRGVLFCRQRLYPEAVAQFHQARESAADPEGRDRAAFFSLIARLLEAGTPEPERSPRRAAELVICGLGYRHPFQVGVGAVGALARCRVLYSNLSDDRVTDFLSLFPGELRAVVFRKWRSQAEVCARQVFAGLRVADGPVGFVTRGHPLFYGALAEKMVLRARRENIRLSVLGSTSIADTILSAAGAAGSALQVLDGSWMASHTDPGHGRRPSVIYNVGEGEARLRLTRRLLKTYPSARRCFLLPGSGSEEYRPASHDIGGLPEPLAAADPAVTVFIPGATS